MSEPEVYNPALIEPKWQERWDRSGLNNADVDQSQPKHYALTMLPYPSGELHIGHWYAMAPSDARARFMRMQGYNVLFPMGFDAFGLPAENAAIKRGIHPQKWTYANIDRMRRQLKTMGTMFDWRREAISSDPQYYRWTQWFFTQLYKHGLAYRKMSPVDWCPNCNTTLAREQVWGEDRHCERCGTPVIRKDLEQWFFRTTHYAEELLDFSDLDWPERVQSLQTNWIGRSEGAMVSFCTENGDEIEIFTTRPDTLWGATFMVLAPEHPLVKRITTQERRDVVDAYVEQASRQTDIQREAIDKEKTGIFTGGYAINPVNQERIPVWIADYVLITYGTGAIMAVPAHDERDFDFAIRHGLPIIPVIERIDKLSKSFVLHGSVCEGLTQALTEAGIDFQASGSGHLAQDDLYITLRDDQIDDYVRIVQDHLLASHWNEVVGTRWLFIFSDRVVDFNSTQADQEILSMCQSLYPPVRVFRTVMEMLQSQNYYQDILFHTDYGKMIHSGMFSDTPGDIARQQVIDWLEQQGIGKRAISYRLRDWLISRQRYWGAPIPIIYCPEHGAVSVPDDQLPVTLPDDVEWLPTGESPLKLHPTWRQTSCPICGEPATRETDTMDTFMCSSWYHLRYLSPDYDQGPFDPAEYDYWMPVDTYTGGIEHATMHLIYTRFFHKAGRDMGIVKGSEPMIQLRNQGIILGEDSEKMSKSRGNVIAPDDLVQRYGADTLRAYLMFFARWDMGAPWSSSGIEGTYRWLRRVWLLILDETSPKPISTDLLRELRRRVHQTLKRVTHDFENFEFNTIVSSLMELLNVMYKMRDSGAKGTVEWVEACDIYLRMLAPVAPHLAEELWERLGYPYSIHTQPWPKIDEDAAAEEVITLVVQVNGKVRDRITIPVSTTEEVAKSIALESETIRKYLGGATPRKVIVVPGKLVNIVV